MQNDTGGKYCLFTCLANATFIFNDLPLQTAQDT